MIAIALNGMLVASRVAIARKDIKRFMVLGERIKVKSDERIVRSNSKCFKLVFITLISDASLKKCDQEAKN